MFNKAGQSNCQGTGIVHGDNITKGKIGCQCTVPFCQISTVLYLVQVWSLADWTLINDQI